MSYTKKQHYISRYIIKKFLNDKGKIDAVLVNSVKRIVQDINNICTENDFYEDKSRDGRYIDRNSTENKFAVMESELASKVEDLFEVLYDERCNDRLRRMYITGEWEHLSVYLMLHLTLSMVRLPKFKEIIFNKHELSLEIKQIFYKELLFGKIEAEILASKNFKNKDLDTIFEVIKFNDTFSGGINELMNHLVNNYFIEIYKAPTEKKFFLSDYPIIINEIEDVDYFMPLSSNFAIAMKKIVKNGQCSIRILPEVSERMIDAINKFIIGNATRVIIVQNMTSLDLDFIRAILNSGTK
ncbi:DUF4238 domain-containing protein [Clostridium sp. YIM B02506]|uniref:DUF4238 domain-containing protein n=1 Tax=Clostridium sp. YIM B02506 TaxID=2910680 RepID=UPI001EED2A39|nr:DUF4238 domain-containing protein [Clostridium sp. YIM B02506]